MADTFKFELVSPERLLLSTEVEAATIPGSDGDMTVMARHAPMMTTLRAGLVEAGGKSIFVRGGFAEVGARGLTVLAEQAVPVEELDAKAFDAALAVIDADLAAAGDDVARQRAEERRGQIMSVRAALGR